MYTDVHISVYTCVHVCTGVYIYMYVFVYEYVCMYMYNIVYLWHIPCSHDVPVFPTTVSVICRCSWGPTNYICIVPFSSHCLGFYDYSLGILRSTHLEKHIAPILKITISIWNSLWIGLPCNWWWAALFFNFSSVSGRTMLNKGR